ncbi:hypothetical protein WDW37_03175 [Bdellovibrionota bacterium FG-1]
MLIRVLAGLCWSALVVASALASADPLFEKMEGEWVGQGIRTQKISGRSVQIETKTRAYRDGDRLVSHNELVEIKPGSVPTTYQRTYWIRPVLNENGETSYELGDQGSVSHGQWLNDRFEVQQELGGDPPYVIRSSTQFAPESSYYHETLWAGARLLAETSIEFHRVSKTLGH